MGFPFPTCSVLLPKPIDDLLDIWDHIKRMIKLAFFLLGLFDTTGDHGSHPLLLGPPSNSSSPITPKSVKKSLPIVEFADFIKRSGEFTDTDGKDEFVDESVCMVCLSHVKGSHKIRELWNCSHVFHVDCLDSWVDLGHMTCPLCRSTLQPEGGDGKRRGKESWMVDRIAYLFGEDLMAMGIDF